ncbi:MAG: DUF4248 domain-containing protein [Bacteroidaceae bacterium]|nr:DUF4248 domain-containing protein [Bacteroidaceae bacterium]
MSLLFQKEYYRKYEHKFLTAQRYYPDKTYRTATRLFRRELEVTKGLLRDLKKAGYTPTSRLLTRTQVRIIEKFIGEA